MRKSVVFTIFIAISLFILLAVLFYFSFVDIQEQMYINKQKIEINRLLDEEQYVEAFEFYNGQEAKYQELLNSQIIKYTEIICSEAISNLSTEKLNKYVDAGGDFREVADTVDEIENKIAGLKISAENYQDGVSYYNKREFQTARISFDKVIEDDENYNNALVYLQELDSRDNSWDNNITGRNAYINSCAFDGQYLYVPFVVDGIDGIYKITKEGIAEQFFPLSDEDGRLYINGINVVGDYVYFIAGEKVGSGYSFDNPYCIYEMKKDGSDLVQVAEGNFTDMYIMGDKVYAISRVNGLVEYDRNFDLQKIICDDYVTEFTFNNNDIIYIVQQNLTYNNDNIIYQYDGNETKEIDRNEYLYYYQFDNNYIKQWQSTPSLEILTYGQKEVAKSDICNFYGIIDDKIIYSNIGSVGQEVFIAYDLNSLETISITPNSSISEYEIVGIFYEDNKLLVEKNNGLFMCDALFNNFNEIDILEISVKLLAQNSKVIKQLKDLDVFYDSSDKQIISVIKDRQNWIYKDDELHIVIEKRYVDEYDTNVYVTHIFTNNYNLLTTGNANSESLSSSRTYKASYISDKFKAIYAQSTDAFYYGINNDQGIIIRHGKVIRDILKEDMIAYFDDGSMEVYSSEDNISCNTLIERGAAEAFSFGPILIKDYNLVTECAFSSVNGRNPRSALGYVEPGHYVMIACDGRDYSVSRGLNMIQLAKLFEQEGCRLAYNLDGGQTAAVLFMGNYITQRPTKKDGSIQHLYRNIAEIFYAGTSESSPTDLTEYTYEYEDFIDIYK